MDIVNKIFCNIPSGLKKFLIKNLTKFFGKYIIEPVVFPFIFFTIINFLFQIGYRIPGALFSTANPPIVIRIQELPPDTSSKEATAKFHKLALSGNERLQNSLEANLGWLCLLFIIIQLIVARVAYKALTKRPKANRTKRKLASLIRKL